jgi:hypothetical protein
MTATNDEDPVHVGPDRIQILSFKYPFTSYPLSVGTFLWFISINCIYISVAEPEPEPEPESPEPYHFATIRHRNRDLALGSGSGSGSQFWV